MYKKLSNIHLLFFSLILSLILTGCIRQTPNTAQNSEANRKTDQSSGGGNDDANSKNENTGNEKALDAETGVNTSATPDKEQRQETIDKYLAGVAKVSDAEEYKEARKVLYGDLDGDGDEDAAAQFTLEGMGGGNMYNLCVAVFKNENGKFSGVTDEVIGGKLSRSVEFTKIENGKMYFDTKSYGPDDGSCCPSIPGKAEFVLEGKKIVEVKSSRENKK